MMVTLLLSFLKVIMIIWSEEQGKLGVKDEGVDECAEKDAGLDEKVDHVEGVAELVTQGFLGILRVVRVEHDHKGIHGCGTDEQPDVPVEAPTELFLDLFLSHLDGINRDQWLRQYLLWT